MFQLPNSKEPISSVHQHQTAQGQRTVIMATSQRLYIFTGKGSLEAIFARYNSKGKAARLCNEYMPNNWHLCSPQTP